MSIKASVSYQRLYLQRNGQTNQHQDLMELRRLHVSHAGDLSAKSLNSDIVTPHPTKSPGALFMKGSKLVLTARSVVD